VICRRLLLAYLAFLLLSHTVLSLSVPTYISFQGKLSNSSSGNPYYPASLRVNITNQTQLSQVEWGPYEFADATDSQGVFDIILGAADQLNLTPGWQYQLVVEVDLDSTTFTTADLTFGDLNPSGDSILVTGGGPATAAQLLMTDNTTTVQVHDHSGGGAGVTVLGPATGWLNVTNDLYVATGISLAGDYRTAWPSGGGVGSVAWIDVGSVLNLNDSVAYVANVTHLMVVSDANLSGDVSLLSGGFSGCGKLYTDTDGKVACGTDATGPGGSADVPYWVDASGHITSNVSINQGNVNVTGNLTLSDRLQSTGSTASGAYAIALGAVNTASGAYSVAVGNDVLATADRAFAFGKSFTNSETNSFAVGFDGTTVIINSTKVVIQDDKVFCFDSDCTVCMYYNNTHLVQESPCTK
jgi:hypothetical protein